MQQRAELLYLPVSHVAAATTSSPTTPSPRDRVHLVEEQNAGRGRSGLIEELADVGFALAEPHGEQLRSYTI